MPENQGNEMSNIASLLVHLDASVSPSHCVVHASTQLRSCGFVEHFFGDLTSGLSNLGFIADAGLLLAWSRSTAPTAPFRIVGAHTDSPCLKIKPKPDSGLLQWKQLGVEIYGGILNNSWLDRDLGLAGRLVLRDGSVRLVNIAMPFARIPQLAVHLDRDVNERGLILDKQQHLLPIWGTGPPHTGEFAQWIAEQVDTTAQHISAWDLGLYDLTPASVLGADRSLLASGRLDNQASCWAAIEALTTAATYGAETEFTSVVALFDHEEVGSQSTHGAAGPRLEWLLEALHQGARTSFHDRLALSHCISADNAHAVHPNYVDRHDHDHQPLPNKGPVLKINSSQRYATTPESAAVFVECCDRAHVPHQVFVTKNTMACGTTIGPTTATRLGIATVDVGIPQLSMHSAREMCGVRDPILLASALKQYFI